MTPSQSMLPVGVLLQGKYRIDSFLASGGFGNTYYATHMALQKPVAIKEFFMKGINHREQDSVSVRVSNYENNAVFEEQMRKFQKEAQRISVLANPHIVKVTDLFAENGTYYYVMEYIDGVSLSMLLKRQESPFSEPVVIDVLNQMLDALSSIHIHSIWHMDIKPGNILMDRFGKCTLIDFGSSKQSGRGDGATTSTAMSYTPGYAPSEQINGLMNKWGPWTDFYALGATLYNLLTKERPPLFDDILENSELAFGNLSYVTPNLRELVVWMMNPLVKNRPQSVEALHNYISNYISVPENSHEETLLVYNDDIEIAPETQEPNLNTKTESTFIDDSDEINVIESPEYDDSKVNTEYPLLATESTSTESEIPSDESPSENEYASSDEEPSDESEYSSEESSSASEESIESEYPSEPEESSTESESESPSAAEESSTESESPSAVEEPTKSKSRKFLWMFSAAAVVALAVIFGRSLFSSDDKSTDSTPVPAETTVVEDKTTPSAPTTSDATATDESQTPSTATASTENPTHTPEKPKEKPSRQTPSAQSTTASSNANTHNRTSQTTTAIPVGQNTSQRQSRRNNNSSSISKPSATSKPTSPSQPQRPQTGPQRPSRQVSNHDLLNSSGSSSGSSVNNSDLLN